MFAHWGSLVFGGEHPECMELLLWAHPMVACLLLPVSGTLRGEVVCQGPSYLPPQAGLG
jgi:hypothetical protein